MMTEDFLKKLDEKFKTKFLKELEWITAESSVPDYKGFKGKLLRTLSAWVAYKFGCDEGHSCQRELKVIIGMMMEDFPFLCGDHTDAFFVREWLDEWFGEGEVETFIKTKADKSVG